MEGEGIVIVRFPFQQVIDTLSRKYTIVAEYDGELAQKVESGKAHLEHGEENYLLFMGGIAQLDDYFRRSRLLLDLQEKGEFIKMSSLIDDSELQQLSEEMGRLTAYIQQPLIAVGKGETYPDPRYEVPLIYLPADSLTVFESGSERNKHMLADIVSDFFDLK